ncbi:PrsW family intramembrane metalloprotease [Angustibacter luteus]|uniref:PrsW family intramembrane metalloprotease n=1 Tax=Angustibacter luteus TaxID=658456 RepID=A0ABW1JH69_9ACTN
MTDQAVQVTVDSSRPVHRYTFVWVLVLGSFIWIVGAVITAVTADDILVPTLILMGSFLVPITMVVFALTREGEDQLSEDWLMLSFILGGSVGVVFAALVETYLLPTAEGTFIMVGLIEETTKALLVIFVARKVTTRRPRDGMVFGATVGAGFAAFESAGYALSALIQHQQNHPVLNILQTEINRAVLAPFGHITWTALFGGALFAASRPDGRLRVTWNLVWTCLGIVTLHALWDQSYGWAILITQGLNGSGWSLEWPNTEAWIGSPNHHDLVVFQVVYAALLIVNATVGASWVFRRWHHYKALAAAREAAAAVAAAPTADGPDPDASTGPSHRR